MCACQELKMFTMKMPEAIFGTSCGIAVYICIPDGEPRGVDGNAMPLFTAPQAHLTSQNLKRGEVNC